MKKYEVEITELLFNYEEVKAKNETEAKENIWEKVIRNDITMDGTDSARVEVVRVEEI